MCEAKTSIFCKNVLLVKWAGLLANEPERVARNLICFVRHSSIWIELTGMGMIAVGVVVPSPGVLGRLQLASPTISMLDAKNIRIIFSPSLDIDKV